MAVLKIIRSNESLNRLRDISVWIDGKQAGTIGNDTTKSFEVKEGNHTVQFKIDWCGSPEINILVKKDEVSTVKVCGFKYNSWLRFLGIGIIGSHILIAYSTGFPYVIFLTIPLFLMLVYYYTLGRMKYLQAEEIH